jgi:hypothetical protein
MILSALVDDGRSRRRFHLRAWNAIVAPRGTPNEIVAKLADALGKALDDPAVQARYVELGITQLVSRYLLKLRKLPRLTALLLFNALS